jgi:hypothetical protein
VLAWSPDLPLDRRLARRGLWHVLLGKFHGRLLPQPLLSLGHDAVLWRAAGAAFLGYYGIQTGEQIERRHLGFDCWWRFWILLDGLHDLLLRCFFWFGLGHVLARVRELAVAVLLCSHGWDFFGTRATSFRVMRALKVEAHLLAPFRVPPTRHAVLLQAILGARLAVGDAVDDEDEVDIFDLQAVATSQDDLLVLVMDVFTEEAVFVQRDGFEDAVLLVELDLQMLPRDGLGPAGDVRPRRVDADEGHVVGRRPEGAEVNSGGPRRVRHILPVEGRVLVLQAGQLAGRGLDLV